MQLVQPRLSLGNNPGAFGTQSTRRTAEGAERRFDCKDKRRPDIRRFSGECTSLARPLYDCGLEAYTP